MNFRRFFVLTIGVLLWANVLQADQPNPSNSPTVEFSHNYELRLSIETPEGSSQVTILVAQPIFRLQVAGFSIKGQLHPRDSGATLLTYDLAVTRHLQVTTGRTTQSSSSSASVLLPYGTETLIMRSSEFSAQVTVAPAS
jgi:hypothetical protein